MSAPPRALRVPEGWCPVLGGHVGFSGTQLGCADRQVVALAQVLVALGCQTLHHGDCVGGDRIAHWIARAMGARVELHPPVDPAKRAFCGMFPGELVHRPGEYLARNLDIVLAVPVLVATPREETGETLRSGTWSTVRRARAHHRRVVIVRPSGAVVWEEPEADGLNLLGGGCVQWT